MSLIPSFILSTLLFCNVSVPGGWEGATLTEGVICEIPYARFTLSVDEQPSGQDTAVMQSVPKNAAVLYNFKKSGLKFAAGTLTVTGTGGTSELSAALPGKTDGRKQLALYAECSWLSLLAATDCKLDTLDSSSTFNQTRHTLQNVFSLFNRALIQVRPDFLCIQDVENQKMECKDCLTAGWFRLSETKDNRWYLDTPWRRAGNLLFFNNAFTLRHTFPTTKLETTGIISLSLPDNLTASAAGCFRTLLKTSHTETAVLLELTPAVFVTPSGSYTNELVRAEAQFSADVKIRNLSSDKEKKAGIFAFKAETAYVQKPSAVIGEQPDQLLSGTTMCSYKSDSLGLEFSLKAADFCIENHFKDGKITPALELTLPGVSLKGEILFQSLTGNEHADADSPAWSVKAERTLTDFTASCTMSYNRTALEKLEFTLSEERGAVALSSGVTIRKTALSWNLAFSQSW